ncbi:MobA-like protein [Mucilaginibacter sp. PPCGB 2223]|uniref:nucleotidyltransferase family protein n=1 Tax=Mucilaginibacter sp. PPCGB 2223 TaxID=1886027 RepID=UPI000825DD8A|nr:nucleotidyltransferase family protein [Mucilaginibacter sp. PPCGB 2223]OCX53712.1 MobA-like protein [Mucilaginibacter sp. PPCGB 2223]
MTGIIILAAGRSARMGRPKQQLPYQGSNLLQHSINVALQSPYRPVIVVLGAFADDIIATIPPKPIDVVINTQWEEGMASSIRAGIDFLLKDSGVDSAMFMLCDQPHISSKLLTDIAQKKKQSGKGIVACSYNNTTGVPVLFDQQYFPELLLLTGQEGAKKILVAHPNDLTTVSFPLGAVDIDTMDDYEKINLGG